MKTNKSLIKLAVILSLIVSLIVSLIACNSKSNKTQKKLSGKITILTDKNHEPMLKLAADNFKKENKKVTIDINTDNNLYSNLESVVKSKKQFSDIVSLEDSYAKYFVDKFSNSFLNVSYDINNYGNRIEKHKVNNLTSKNKIYGFPWSTSPKIIIYRKDIFEKEGINADDIKTWDDYIQAGQKINCDTGKKLLANVEYPDDNIYLIMSNQLGTSYFNGDDKLDFNSNNAVKVADMIKKLYAGNVISDVKSRKKVVASILNGESFSIIGDAEYISYLTHNFPNYKGKLGIMKIPAFEPGGNRDVSIGGCNLLINSSSKNADIAKEFCKFCVSDEHTIIDSIKNYGYFPAFSEAYNLVEFNNNMGYFNQRAWSILASVENGSMYLNYTQNFLKIEDSCNKVLSGDNLNNKQSKDVLDALQKSLQTDKTIK